MMQQEFEDRAKFEVSADCYHKCIEPEYNASALDKDEWVKEWKKNGGIQKAYNWERMNRQQAEKEAKAAHEITKSVTEERDFYMKKAENLEESNKGYIGEVQQMDDIVATATEQRNQLAEFIVEAGAAHKDEGMFKKAKEVLGVKRYITFKLTSNIELTEEDKKLIMAILK